MLIKKLLLLSCVTGLLCLAGLFTSPAMAQTGSITGIITDIQTGQTIPGSNILLAGTQRGAASNTNGHYTISDVPAGTYTLRVTFIGYKKFNTQVTIEAGQTLNSDVALQPTAISLGQLVVTGYGTESKAKSISSSTTIQGQNLSTQPVVSVSEALVGQVAGVNIAHTTGQPGANLNIRIRGITSINGSSEPIAILNGIPIDEDNLSMINPHSIKSITILKGPSATAIYGSEGAGGVIVIQTKTGQFEQPLQVNYHGSIQSASLQDVKYNRLSGPQELTLEKNTGQRQVPLPPPYGDGDLDTPLTKEDIASAPTTNWVDYFFDPTFSQTHNLSIARGYENVRLYTGLEFSKTEGALNTGTGFHRYSLINNVSGLSDNGKFSYKVNTTLSYSVNNTQTNLGTGGINQNPLLAAKQSVPYLTPQMYPGTGIGMFQMFAANQSFAYTPLFLVDKLKHNTNQFRETDVVGSLKMSYDLMDNLVLTGLIGGQYERNFAQFTQAPTSFNSILFGAGHNFLGSANNSTVRAFTYRFNLNLKYNTVIGKKNQLQAAAFFEVNQGYYKTFGFTSNGLNAKTFDPGDGSGFVPDNPNNDFYVDPIFLNQLQSGKVSYFSSLKYDYGTRFGAKLTFRRDGSYRFIDQNRWGAFYSAGGYVNLASFSFMDGNTFGLLKVRFDYGKTGQSNITGANGLFSTFGGADLVRSLYATGSGYAGLPSIGLSQIGNPLLQWETVYKYDVGVDFRVMNARLTGKLDLYRKTTKNLFTTKPVSAITSLTALNANAGTLRNKGIEVQLNYQILRSNNGLNITLGATVAYNHNEIIDIPDPDGTVILGSTVRHEGSPIFEYYLVPYAGVNNEDGNLLFINAKGEKIENPTVPDSRVFTGKNILPEYQGGISLDFRYKGIFMLTDWDWTQGVWRFDNVYASLIDPDAIGQFVSGEDILDHWTPDNKDSKIPSLNVSNDGAYNSDRFLRDSDYFRLRFIKLGYQLPATLLKPVSIRGFTIYLSATNLLTITPWKGLDPSLDSNNGVLYPSPKIVSAGININF